MINSYDELFAVISADPEIDPTIFWNQIGVSLDDVVRLARDSARSLPVDPRAALVLMEVGATIAIHHAKKLAEEE